MSPFQNEILKFISVFWNSNSKNDDAFLKALSLLTETPIVNKEFYFVLKLNIFGIPVNYITVSNPQRFLQSFNIEGISFICKNENLKNDYLTKLNKKNILCDFINIDEKNILMEGCDITQFSIYKIYKTFIEENNSTNTLILNTQISIFYENLSQTKFELQNFELSKLIQNKSITEHPRNLIKNNQTDKMLNIIASDNFKSIFLIGNSASGKTSIALQASYLFKTKSTNSKVFYLNCHILNNFNITRLLIDIFKIALTLKNSKVIIVIDDLHSNLYATKRIFSLFELISKNEKLSKNIVFIGISWKDFVNDLITETDINSHTIDVSSDYISNKLLNRIELSNSDKKLILEYIEGNLFLLSAIIDLVKIENKSIKQTIKKLPQYLYDKLEIDNENLKKGIYLTSILGKYEIDITEKFLIDIAELHNEDIKYLIEKRILRIRGNDYTLGHKTYCNLLNKAIQETEHKISQWFIDKSFSTYADIILEFLYTQKSNKIFSIIQKLYKHADIDSLKRKQNIIFKTWKSIDLTIDRMLIQQRKDPTWDNTLSSAMFAVQTLSSVGYKEEAKLSLDYIRSLYNNEFEIDLSNEANSRDFNKIKSEMISQDKVENLYGEKGRDLDERQFYLNWAKGVILSAEGSYNETNTKSLNNLCDKVIDLAIEKKYFYPLRVPWCTARVLIGLGLSGKTIENNNSISNVVEWLLNHPNKTSQGAWVSGTGNWNNWVETTSLSVISLLRVGIPKNNEDIKKAINLLYSKKEEWIKDGKQIDGVTALQAYIYAGGDLMNVLDEISYFSDWITNALWKNDNKTHLELLKQSCAVAQISFGLTEVMWQFIQEDLPRLIQSFDVDRNRLSANKKPIIFISYSWEETEDKEWVEEIFVPALIEHFGSDNIIFDLNDMLNHQDNYHFMEKSIREADIYLPVCNQSYKRKANNRESAVGTEVKYMTANIETNKKIVFPILKSGEQNEIIPTFLIGKFFLDFRIESNFEQSFNKLVNYIFKSFK